MTEHSTMKEHRPHGMAPATLEAGILKIFAFEMLMILFYLEELRKFITGRSVLYLN